MTSVPLSLKYSTFSSDDSNFFKKILSGIYLDPSGDIFYTFEVISNLLNFVTPAKAGVQNTWKKLDSGFCRNETMGLLQKALFDNHNHKQR